MRRVCLVFTILGYLSAALMADDYTLATADGAPQDLPATLAELVDPAGHKVIGPKRDLCSLWLLKDVALQPDFAPSTAVKYPFTPGQLVGVLSVPRRAGLTDFKGQEIESGLYSLRYGQQPVDGNHIGTSDTADFLLAVPIAEDADPAPVADLKALFKQSAGASGTTHPAIFSLLPAEGDAAEPGLTHDAEHEFWILNFTATAGDQQVPLRLVVVGESKG